MNFAIGLVITVGCILGGYAALGGHLEVLMQPYEFVIIAGSSLGIFIVANAMTTIKDCGKAFLEAVLDKVPKPRDFLDVLERAARVDARIESQVAQRSRSALRQPAANPRSSRTFPKLLANKDLVTFICDYGRLIIIGNARTHEIEALMDEEIETLAHDRYKPVHAFQAVADGLPALGIVAAVLGIIHAMGALDQSPEILGGLIGAALVGTFAGIFLSYAIVAPIAQKIKAVRQKQLRLFTLVKQSLLAFMNGAMPQVAVEFGRKTIPSKERPTIDVVENETTSARGGERRDQGGGVSIDGATNESRPWRAASCKGAMLEHSEPRDRANARARLRPRPISSPRRRSDHSLAHRAPFRRLDRGGSRNDAISGDRRLLRPDRRRSMRATNRRRGCSIALDERIDDLIVSSIFGEVIAAEGPSKSGSEAGKPRTAIEAALIEAFARALGRGARGGLRAARPDHPRASSGFRRSRIHLRLAGGTARRRRRDFRCR